MARIRIASARTLGVGIAAVAILAFRWPAATAQTVVGLVVEEGSGVPVVGAMVSLFDAEGERIDRMLSTAAGRFGLRARGGGSHYLKVERIGYATTETPAFEPTDDDPPHRIEVPVEAISLAGIDVQGGRRCEVRPEEGNVTARVWDEVQKALSAEAWAREAALYRYTLLRFERTLDRDAREVLWDTTAVSEDRDAAFFSIPPDELAQGGFVQAVGDTATVYYAPDAGALLSDAFLDTHCLRVREGDAGRIGLEFQPLPDRAVPDIAGVLWVDAETSELDRLEFRYVNLLESREIGEPGGEVEFVRLPNGAWIVGFWRIRMPRLERTGVLRMRIRRMAYREEGGFTRSITEASGRRILDATAATVFGVVTDSLGAGPPGELVSVELAGSGARATPDDDGTFVIGGLATGEHRVRVQRVPLERWGLVAPAATVVGRFGEVAFVRLRLPTMTDALVAACGGEPRPAGTAIVLGRVREEGGPPVGGTQVTVRWPAATGFRPAPISVPPTRDPVPAGEASAQWRAGSDGRYATAETTTDERGAFLVCDVPEGMRLGVRAVAAGADASAEGFRTWFVAPGARVAIEEIVR